MHFNQFDGYFCPEVSERECQMEWVSHLLELLKYSAPYQFTAQYPAVVIPAAVILLAVMHRNFKAGLTFAFAGVLCYANYYLFSQQLYATLPLLYTGAFAAISAISLVLIVFHLIQTA